MIDPPIKYHGGKFYLRDWILEKFPARDSYLHYVEPYGGGASVLLGRDPDGKSEVLNDIDGRLQTFWDVLKDDDKFSSFCKLANATPFSAVEYRRAAEAVLQDDPVQVAWGLFVLARQSLAGRQKGFASVSISRTRRGMNEQVSAWLTALDGLPAVHARLHRVFLSNEPALLAERREGQPTLFTGLLVRQDGPQTCMYLDPPYIPETRTSRKVYVSEMTYEQHEDLIDYLIHGNPKTGAPKSKILLSGYRHELYDKLLEHGWNLETRASTLHSAGGVAKQQKLEALYRNFV